jgi:phosphoribosyl-ATP pyrophosphohydrolase
MNILNLLVKKIKNNKKKNTNRSYTALLFFKGKKYILNKFVEEVKELIEALKKNNKKNIIHECADTLFHLLVVLEQKKVNLNSVMKELNERRKITGLEEKRRRKNVRQK